MSDEENDIDLIEAYLKGELKGAALKSFEARRAANAAFDKTVVDYSLIIEEIRASGQLGFHDKVKQWETEIADSEKKEAKPKVVPMWRSMYIAAALVLFAVAGTYIVISTSPSVSSD